MDDLDELKKIAHTSQNVADGRLGEREMPASTVVVQKKQTPKSGGGSDLDEWSLGQKSKTDAKVEQTQNNEEDDDDDTVDMDDDDSNDMDDDDDVDDSDDQDDDADSKTKVDNGSPSKGVDTMTAELSTMSLEQPTQSSSKATKGEHGDTQSVCSSVVTSAGGKQKQPSVASSPSLSSKLSSRSSNGAVEVENVVSKGDVLQRNKNNASTSKGGEIDLSSMSSQFTESESDTSTPRKQSKKRRSSSSGVSSDSSSSAMCPSVDHKRVKHNLRKNAKKTSASTSAAERKSSGPPPDRKEARRLFRNIQRRSRQGLIVDETLTLHSSIHALREESNSLDEQHKEQAGIQFYQSLTIQGLSLLEAGSKKVRQKYKTGPNLTGLAQDFEEEAMDHETLFAELYKKYGTKTEPSPLFMLGWVLCQSMRRQHLKNAELDKKLAAIEESRLQLLQQQQHMQQMAQFYPQAQRLAAPSGPNVPTPSASETVIHPSSDLLAQIGRLQKQQPNPSSQQPKVSTIPPTPSTVSNPTNPNTNSKIESSPPISFIEASASKSVFKAPSPPLQASKNVSISDMDVDPNPSAYLSPKAGGLPVATLMRSPTGMLARGVHL